MGPIGYALYETLSLRTRAQWPSQYNGLDIGRLLDEFSTRLLDHGSLLPSYRGGPQSSTLPHIR